MFCKQSCPIRNWLLGWEEMNLDMIETAFFSIDLTFDKASQAHHMFNLVQFDVMIIC